MMLGEKIKKMRIKNKMTQQDLADKLFVSDKTVSSWESGRTEPDINMLSDICGALNSNFFELINDSEKNNVELELKIKVNEKEQQRILELIKKDSVFIKEEDQNAVYYKLSHRDMNSEWLRIRRENSNYVLNYKKKNDDVIEEYEVLIDNVNNLKQIFNYLDFKESIHVDKHRIAYLYKDKYEFSFDDVKCLGLYVEIELKKFDDSFDVEAKNMLDLLKLLSININNIEIRRYPELIEKWTDK